MKSSKTTSKIRHFGTIGVEDIFLEPPSHPLPNSYLHDKNKSRKYSFLSWEILGNIKDSPEDFVVREIAKPGRTIAGEEVHSKEAPHALQVADIVPDDGQQFRNATKVDAMDRIEKVQTKPDEKPSLVDNGFDPKSNPLDPTNEPDKISQQNTNAQSRYIEPENFPPPPEPIQTIRAVLTHVLDAKEDPSKVEAVMISLQSLQDLATARLSRIKNNPTKQTTNTNPIFLPSIPADFSQLVNSAEITQVDRKEFHRAFRETFPMLQTETLPTNNHQIKVSIDTFFDELIPHLYNPSEDLPKLYRFQKKGIATTAFSTKHNHGKRKRDSSSADETPILRLRPDLTKNERRPIHRLLAQKNRAFETKTLSNIPLKNDGNSKTTTTSAIQVQWSFHAQKRARNKSQNNGSNGKKINRKEQSNKVEEPNPHTLCVVKKRGKEHLTALSAIAAAVKCRTSDVGLAGIKDMKAVTYQFCTFRNIGPMRLLKARPHLRDKGIELGMIRRVDFMLQNGDLQGNRFTIVLRNMRQVQVQVGSGKIGETFFPCTRQHVQQMFDRIQRSGFINFYGEQRVGTPGETAEVGARTFDIGRAMLQGDFNKAIDLLMTGRSLTHGKDNPQEAKIRQVWKESGGDPAATLKAFPKGDIMTRERAILKGLNRYGKDEPLAALQCLPHNVRNFWVHAYQSLVWNRMASARISRLGSSAAVVGDLYLGRDAGQDIRLVNSENVSKISIHQVVLPLPGYNIIYPENEIGDLYKEYLETDKIQFNKKSPDEATAKGAYRLLIANPENLGLEFEGVAHDDVANQDVSTAKLSFDLQAGSYATMLLRELMLTTIVRG